MSEHAAENGARREPACSACGALIRVDRALLTCDTAKCPGNIYRSVVPPA